MKKSLTQIKTVLFLAFLLSVCVLFWLHFFLPPYFSFLVLFVFRQKNGWGKRILTHFMLNETRNHVGEACTKAAINRPAFITLIDFLTSRYSSVKSSTRKGNDVTRPMLSSVCKFRGVSARFFFSFMHACTRQRMQG